MLDHVDFKNGRDLILHAAQSRAQELRLTAYEIIGRSGGEAEIALLSAALESAREPMDRAQIVWSLARIGRPASIPILLEVIQDRASETRYTAADGLARIAGRMSN
jgi:HEAT repeat protein